MEGGTATPLPSVARIATPCRYAPSRLAHPPPTRRGRWLLGRAKGRCCRRVATRRALPADPCSRPNALPPGAPPRRARARSRVRRVAARAKKNNNKTRKKRKRGTKTHHSAASTADAGAPPPPPSPRVSRHSQTVLASPTAATAAPSAANAAPMSGVVASRPGSATAAVTVTADRGGNGGVGGGGGGGRQP